MTKRRLLVTAVLLGSTLWLTGCLEADPEKGLNEYTNEKYGFHVEIIDDKDAPSTEYLVKREDRPEDVFTIEFVSSNEESDNYVEAEILHDFNEQLAVSEEYQTLDKLGFHHSHVTHYYGTDERKLHDLNTALFLYLDQGMAASDAKRFHDAIPVIEKVKENLEKTGNELETVIIFRSTAYPSLYKNKTNQEASKSDVRFPVSQIEPVPSVEEIQSLIGKQMND
ncbi:hypothetical protein NQ095_06490 [Rossellomorea sp. SC111]|uniref:hypothetical protein n=1 Tax=Rossellomorea sp. SC111 TaxID=2968985 RepID=UPI00215AE718|nr:hypothetical protein [Rossellomorea sp. SC111]MCR8848050.1 hypothetical protein [Rossellomorea sp. SC111]